jgi:hypothetical protein
VLFRSGRISKIDDYGLATKVVIPFHPSLYCTNNLPETAAVYSDSGPLFFQDIFIFVFCASINNYINLMTPFKARFLFVFSGLPQADLETGAGISPVFHPFLCPDGLSLAYPSS